MRDSFGDRIKSNYENIAKFRLTRRTPVIVRVDGKAFHTFTRGFERPFDFPLREAMSNTMKYLCENVQGCVFGYCQSDEISLLLVDYKKLTSEAYFDYEVQKIASVTASTATMFFNKEFFRQVSSLPDATPYQKSLENAIFDSRCFNIPREEVTNYFYWRQLDATRNSINLVGQSYFSRKELHGKNTDQVQDMLFIKYGINWNDYPIEYKRGVACFKNEDGKWRIDKEMPILRNTDREYVERWVNPDKEEENE